MDSHKIDQLYCVLDTLREKAYKIDEKEIGKDWIKAHRAYKFLKKFLENKPPSYEKVKQMYWDYQIQMDEYLDLETEKQQKEDELWERKCLKIKASIDYDGKIYTLKINSPDTTVFVKSSTPDVIAREIIHFEGLRVESVAGIDPAVKRWINHYRY